MGRFKTHGYGRIKGEEEKIEPEGSLNYHIQGNDETAGCQAVPHARGEEEKKKEKRLDHMKAVKFGSVMDVPMTSLGFCPSLKMDAT